MMVLAVALSASRFLLLTYAMRSMTYETTKSWVLVVCVVFYSGIVRLERRLAITRNLHDTRQVTASVAVIRCGPYSDERIVKHVLVTLLDKLMGSCDEF